MRSLLLGILALAIFALIALGAWIVDLFLPRDGDFLDPDES